MTSNQIAYFKAKQEATHWERSDEETKRHDIRTESLTEQSNQISKEHYERSDAETQRHDIATEDISRTEAETHRLNLYETVRHNQNTEQLGWATYGETVKHNRAMEGIGYANVALGYANVDLGYANLAETSAHNRNTEYLTGLNIEETQKHNREMESQTRDVNASQANLNWWRGNVAQSEKELNMQKFSESQAQEQLTREKTSLARGESYSQQFSNYAKGIYMLSGTLKNIFGGGGSIGDYFATSGGDAYNYNAVW